MFALRRTVEYTLNKLESDGLNGPALSALRMLGYEFIDAIESRVWTTYTNGKVSYTKKLASRLRLIADLLEASVNGGEKATLKVGGEENKRIVETVERTLRWLSEEHPITWNILVKACQDGPKSEIYGQPRMVLKLHGLLSDSGDVPEFIKPLVLSAASKQSQMGDQITTPLMREETNVPV